MMEESLDLADEVMNEGRERVKDLRTGQQRAGGLSRSFLLAGAEILSRSAMEISVIEEGATQEDSTRRSRRSLPDWQGSHDQFGTPLRREANGSGDCVRPQRITYPLSG